MTTGGPGHPAAPDADEATCGACGRRYSRVWAGCPVCSAPTPDDLLAAAAQWVAGDPLPLQLADARTRRAQAHLAGEAAGLTGAALLKAVRSDTPVPITHDEDGHLLPQLTRPLRTEAVAEADEEPLQLIDVDDEPTAAGPVDPLGDALDDIVDAWHTNAWPGRSLREVIRDATGWTDAQYDQWVLTGTTA